MDVHELKVFKEEYRIRGDLLMRTRRIVNAQLEFQGPCDHSVGICCCDEKILVRDITRCLDGKGTETP